VVHLCGTVKLVNVAGAMKNFEIYLCLYCVYYLQYADIILTNKENVHILSSVISSSRCGIASL